MNDARLRGKSQAIQHNSALPKVGQSLRRASLCVLPLRALRVWVMVCYVLRPFAAHPAIQRVRAFTAWRKVVVSLRWRFAIRVASCIRLPMLQGSAPIIAFESYSGKSMAKGGWRIGAGRPGYRVKAEDSLVLDIRWLKSNNVLISGNIRTVTWHFDCVQIIAERR